MTFTAAIRVWLAFYTNVSDVEFFQGHSTEPARVTKEGYVNTSQAPHGKLFMPLGSEWWISGVAGRTVLIPAVRDPKHGLLPPAFPLVVSPWPL